MRLGIIGLPQCGKTTIFNALTGQALSTGFGASGGGQMEVHTGVVDVPDARLDWLTDLYHPKKKTYATVTYKDIGGLDKGVGEGGLSGPLRNELATVDGFVHVLRAFDDDNVPHPLDSVDPQRDLETIEGEFLLLDLIAVEGRLVRLKDEWTKKPELRRQNERESALMERLQAHLETDQPLRTLATELTPDDMKLLRGYGLLTLKPMLILLNSGDDAPPPETLVTWQQPRTALATLRGQIEAEIAQLGPEDQEVFMAEYGIDELGAQRVIRLSYDLLGILSFFTVGDDEVRAWSLHAGGTAVEAAGTIHTDLARGFIRAEVVPYDVLRELGEMKAVKAAGKQRLEGKEYSVLDGDIITVRFNV
ncbi:MAG: redox-regulated ATPase YchF [Anaerolineae bacterium]|nr:redox-regulated ATPase YchF [Anaerolineae bacterium]